MSLTLQHDSTTQSLEAWGMSNPVLQLNSLAASTLTVTLAGPHDVDTGIEEGDTITLREGGIVRFVGRLRDDPGTASGSSEARTLKFEDVFGDLARRTVLQGWPAWTGEEVETVQRPIAVLFGDTEGQVSISAQIEALITAAASAGVSIQCGASAGITAAPQAQDVRSMSYLEVLKACCKYAPDVTTWVDYTTSPVTVNFVRRASGADRTLAVVDGADEFSFQPLYQQRVSAVVLSYAKTVEVPSGDILDASYQDKYPAEATGNEENALVIHKKLAVARIGGSAATPTPQMTQAQYIQTVAISSESFSFWELLWPALAGRNEEATLDDGEVSESGFRMILNGAQPEWTGEAQIITVSAIFNGIIDGVPHVGRRLTARVNGSTLSTGTYYRAGSTGAPPTSEAEPALGEWVPTGIAQSLYNALSVLQWQVSHARTDDATDWTIKPSDVVDFTGTEHPGLASAQAQVQRVTYDLHTGKRTVECGPGAVLQFGDLMELMSMLRTVPEGTQLAEQAGVAPAASMSVLGAGMGPGSSLIMDDQAPAHPFMVRHVSGNNYRVEAGQIDGYTLASETVNIGSGRPRAIGIVVKYTMSISNSEYLYSATLKTTGDDVPVLAVSSTISDAVVIAPAGTGGACVIAVIDSSDVVSQIASGNVLSSLEDDASWTGGGVVSFEKNH